MTTRNLPMAGDKLFLMHRLVIVTRVYSAFHLVKVRYSEDVLEFFVDICALTAIPDLTNSIPIL